MARMPSLVVFHAPSATRVLRLPIVCEPLVTVEERFYLKPLIALLAEPGRFYVLAMSQNATRLLEVTRDEVRRIGVEELPASLDTTLPDDTGEKQLQYHSAGHGGAMYHGQGAGEHRRAEDNIRRFLKAADAGLLSSVPDREAPLVLAGVSELTAAFRRLSSHPELVAETVEGNVDTLSDGELRRRAYPLADSRLRQTRNRARERFRELANADRTATRIEEIVRAAADGRVDTLFMDRGARIWGLYDPTARSVELEEEQSSENEDLLDLAALRTFERGGTVFALEAREMPARDACVAAILRY